MKIDPYQTFNNTSALKIIGDVRTVLNGCVTESKLQENVLNRLMFGLGGGSFTDCMSLGETIVLNQIGYGTHVDSQVDINADVDVNAKDRLIETKGKKDLKSPFLMGLEKNCRPSTLLQVDSTNGIDLNRLYEKFGQGLYGYAFVGSILFEKLYCTYLKKSPMFNESINDNVEQYWATTEEHLECYAYLFGVIITEKGINHFPKDMLQKAFYINPLEKNQGAIVSHTHAVLVDTIPPFGTLKQDLKFYESFEPTLIIGTRHILTQSILKEGLMAIFNINEIR